MRSKIMTCCEILKSLGYKQHQIDEIIRFCAGTTRLAHLNDKDAATPLKNLQKHIQLSRKFLELCK